MVPAICIDPEIASLLTPLTAEEAGLLERSLLDEGCREALTVWTRGNVLLDGHHRYRLCTAHGIPFDVRAIDLPDRRSAVEWRLVAQLSRRNLTAIQAAYFRGKLFESAKKPGSRTDLTSRQSVARSLAARWGIDRRTLGRDATFAHNLDKVAATLGADFRMMVLTRQARLTRREVADLARMPPGERADFVKMGAGSNARGRKAKRPGPLFGTPEEHMPTYDSKDQEPGLLPDLHAAWERANYDERLLFLGRPDVLAAAMEVLRFGRQEGVA